MLVTENNISDVLLDIRHSDIIGFDTETTGLHFEDRLFSLIISTDQKEYYFNFNDQPDHHGALHVYLDRQIIGRIAQETFGHSIWGSHNAKFDLQKLNLEGFGIPASVHCTLTTERLIRNDRLDYSLDAIAPLYGCSKDRTLEEYITKHKLYTNVIIPGKKRVDKKPHFDKVPLPIIQAYGEIDARCHRTITESQLKLI